MIRSEIFGNFCCNGLVGANREPHPHLLEVKKVYQKFLQAGMKDVSCKLYKNDRHEILNETDREQVYADLLGWMKKRIK